MRRHGLRWLRAALDEARKLDDASHIRNTLATFFGHVGQHNCGEHGDGDEICCGNQLMRQYLEGFSDPLGPAQIPYDEDPNARPDPSWIHAMFGDPKTSVQTVSMARVRRGEHPLGRYLKAKAEAEAACRG